MPWKAWPPQQYQNQPTQGRQGYNYGTQPSQQMYPQQPFQYQQFQQHPQPMSFPQKNIAPLLTQPQQLQLPSNQPPPRPTQLPVKPVANPSNEVEIPSYNVEEVTYFPTYSSLHIQDVHLRSGKLLHKDSPPNIEE